MSVTGDSTGPDDPTTVLLLAPKVRGAAAGACTNPIDDGDVDRVVAVTITQSAESWLDSRGDRAATSGASVTCIDVDGERRSAATDRVSGWPDVDVERVSNPQNLERVGRKASSVLQQADENDDRVGIVVHSVGDLLQHVDEPTAFKFVYTLGEVARRVDGVACFHLEEEAHTDQTVETFSAVCDAVSEVDRDLAVSAREE